MIAGAWRTRPRGYMKDGWEKLLIPPNHDFFWLESSIGSCKESDYLLDWLDMADRL